MLLDSRLPVRYQRETRITWPSKGGHVTYCEAATAIRRGLWVEWIFETQAFQKLKLPFRRVLLSALPRQPSGGRKGQKSSSGCGAEPSQRRPEQRFGQVRIAGDPQRFSLCIDHQSETLPRALQPQQGLEMAFLGGQGNHRPLARLEFAST